jgi:hypothetical protein
VLPLPKCCKDIAEQTIQCKIYSIKKLKLPVKITDFVLMKNPQIKIPDEFYFGKPTAVSNEKPDLKGYF